MTEDDSGGSIGRTSPSPPMDPGGARLDRRVEVLSDVIGAFADATTDYDALLDVISRKLAEVIGDLCSVLLLSPDGATLSIVAMHDPDPAVLALAHETFDDNPMLVVPVQQRVLETGEAFVAPTISPNQTRQTTTDTRAEFTAKIGMHSVLLVALRARGEAIGVINMVRHRRERPGYTDDDRDLAQQLADHAAVAITNARLLRKQHDELRAAKQVADAANRELEAFSYSVAHDLRAPLRSIDGFASALEGDYGDRLDEDGRRFLARIRAAAKRMGHLIDDLLALARLSRTPIARQRTDVTELARRVGAELAARAPERRVELRVADGLVADADPRLLQVVFENLLGNAWKFTAKQPAAAIEVGSEGIGTFFVRDNGAGFDRSQADRLFAPFQRLHTEAQFEGTGIGLATVHRIIARHGGRIWADAEVGLGATFRFTL